MAALCRDAATGTWFPEVRRFYSAFHAAWPYWLYFCNLDVDTLRAMVACCLPSLIAGQVDGQTEVLVKFEPLELLQLLQQDFAPMNAMCERGEMFEHLIFDRTRRVFEYFNLPFDPGPRGGGKGRDAPGGWMSTFRKHVLERRTFQKLRAQQAAPSSEAV